MKCQRQSGRRWLSRWVLALGLVTGAAASGADVAAQAPDEVFLGAERSPVRVSIMPVFQRYVDGVAISEFSVPISLLVPLGSNIGVSLQTSPAAASGDDLTQLGGLSDARVAVSYFGRLGRSSLGLSLTANLPSGKRELSRDEFQTSVLLSQNMFDFRVPVFGQGFNLAPGITFATPLGESAVVGLGVAYHYRGAFTPVDDGLSYDPGDELLITGGVSFAVAELWSLAGDVSFARYQMDTVDGSDRYQSGNKWTVTGQILRPIGEHQFRILARYRTRAPGEIPVVDGLVTEDERMVPDQFLGRVAVRLRGSRVAHVTLLGQARTFSETALFPSMTVFDAGVMPEYAINDAWTMLLRFVYTLGDFSGFEGGLGVSARL